MRPTRWEPLARNEREARTVEALKSEEPSVRRVRARAPALPVSDLLRSARDFLGKAQQRRNVIAWANATAQVKGVERDKR